MLCDHVQQLRVTGVGTEPAAVSSAVSVDWGKQPVFLTELVGVNLGHAVLGKQTDLLHAVQTRKAFGFILRDADIAHGVRRKRGIVLSDGRDFAVPIDRAHPGPRKTANLALMRSAGDNVMEYVIVGLVGMKNGELDAQLLCSFFLLSFLRYKITAFLCGLLVLLDAMGLLNLFPAVFGVILACFLQYYFFYILPMYLLCKLGCFSIRSTRR